MKPKGYFWKDGELVTTPVPPYVTLAMEHGVQDCLCVDTSCVEPLQRYGMFVHKGGWESVPIEEFPPEFLVHLLLEGVGI